MSILALGRKQRRKIPNQRVRESKKERKFSNKRGGESKKKERKFPIKHRKKKKYAERSLDQTISKEYRIVTK